MESREVPGNDQPTESKGDDNFAASLGDYLARSERYDPPKKNQLVSGRIATVNDREILIDLGAKSEGIVVGKEMEALPRDFRATLEVGQEVYAYVISPEDRNGNVVLSLAKAINERDWRTAEELFQKQDALESHIAGFNKGGVIVKVGRLRGFVPASQLSLSHQRMMGDDSQPPEQRYQKLVGQPTYVKVIEIDRERNRLILSERAASKEARAAQKDKLLSEIDIDSIVEGEVSSVKDFGVFVDLGGADGMIHLSELSYQRVKHPSEVVREGDHVKVKVISVDRESGRIGLSLKSLQTDPWSDLDKRYRPGQLVEAEVIKIHPKHGAFARLKDDEAIEGLIPLSELSDKMVANPREILKEGQIVTLRVMRVEPEQKRIALSLKRVSWAEYADLDWQSELPAGEVAAASEDSVEEPKE
ncbi:MAG: S1 RNA-binding domain-containing protein [Chloroflexi bacterium]|nr:S1 RNA-binding domain-containing protein [Chloroflexota bacterium]MCL5273326.1 S1 RNA-binding domain-containing protein [Chloroflexota bacterium]